MPHLSPFHWLSLLALLVLLPVSTFLPQILAQPKVSASDLCGSWTVKTSDSRVMARLIENATSDDCRVVISIENNTQFSMGQLLSIGGYTMALKASPQNAQIHDSTPSSYLWPSIKVEITASPISKESKGYITIEGSTSPDTILQDTKYFVIREAIHLVPLGNCLLPPPETVASAAINTQTQLDDAVQLALQGSYDKAWSSIQLRSDELLETAADILGSQETSCVSDLLKQILKEPAKKAILIGQVMADYLVEAWS